MAAEDEQTARYFVRPQQWSQQVAHCGIVAGVVTTAMPPPGYWFYLRERNGLFIVIKADLMRPQVTIEYCPRCGWMLRAAYMAQELLTTFTSEISGVLLRPSEINGRYTVFVADEVLFDRKREGRFPETKELKQLLRDRVAPGKSLGHSDKGA